MKLTLDDVKEVVKNAQQIGADPHDEATKASAALLAMLINLDDYATLIREIPTHILLEAIKSGKTSQPHLLNLTAQMGVLSGISIGFQLGLREAGLELGIGASATSTGK